MAHRGWNVVLVIASLLCAVLAATYASPRLPADTPVEEVLAALREVYVDDAVCAKALRRNFFDPARPDIALASYPRSGNSWTRHVLEQASGRITGGIYLDRMIRDSGLYGEMTMENSILIKTHVRNDTLWAFEYENARRQKRAVLPGPWPIVQSQGAVVLIRSPWDSIFSEYQFHSTGFKHILTTEKIDPPAWHRHVAWAIDGWLGFHNYWLRERESNYPVHILRYEDLKYDTLREIVKVLKFLNVELDLVRIKCAAAGSDCAKQPLNCRSGRSGGAALRHFNNDQRRWLLAKLGPLMTRLGYSTNVTFDGEPCPEGSDFYESAKETLEMVSPLKAVTQEERIAERPRKKQVPLILLWPGTGSWHTIGMPDNWWNPWTGMNVRKRPTQCEWTKDTRRFADADVVLTEAVGFSSATDKREWCTHRFPFPDSKPVHQEWAVLTYEVPVQYRIMDSPTFTRAFDYEISWRAPPLARYQFNLHCPSPTNRTLLSPPNPNKKTDVLAIYVQSRCLARERDYIVGNMMRYMKIDSFGRCLHNADSGEERTWPRPWDHKIALNGQYKFILIFENSQFTDWVTEKVYHALLSGALPVYWGADNIDEYIPQPRSIVKVSDFASPRALVDYLLYLNANQTAYDEYFEWKKSGDLSAVHRMEQLCAYEVGERLCDDLVQRLRLAPANGKRLQGRWLEVPDSQFRPPLEPPTGPPEPPHRSHVPQPEAPLELAQWRKWADDVDAARFDASAMSAQALHDAHEAERVVRVLMQARPNQSEFVAPLMPGAPPLP